MKTLPFVLAAVLAVPAAMADKPKLEPLPEIPPPPGMHDASEEPQVTITTRGGEKFEEYRIRGRLYAIKVSRPEKPDKKPYYLIDVRGDGQMVRQDDLSPNFMVPMWMIPTQ